MALFKKTMRKPDEEIIIPYISSDPVHSADSPEPLEEVEIEETSWPPDVGTPLPKRRIMIDAETNEDEVVVDDAPVTAITLSGKLKKPQTAKRDKVYLSTDIRRDLHARLRIHSFTTHKSLGTLVEEMILKYCPE